MFPRILVFVGCAFGALTIALAQSATFGAAVGVIVFPADGQEAAEQSRDEADCYNWAAGHTGSDPFQLERQAAEQQAASEAALNTFRTAFSTCMEANNYIARF